jgi:DNA invertase Pin-like site-specific DNA recombinase
MVATIGYLQTLAATGVAFRSYTEPHLSTESELVRNVLLALMSSLAKAEAERLSARVKAGMANARAKGKRIGRPAIDARMRQRIATMAAQGESAYAIGKHLGIDRHTAAKYAEAR